MTVLRAVFFFAVGAAVHLLGARWLLSTLSRVGRKTWRRRMYGAAVLFSLLLGFARLVARRYPTQFIRGFGAVTMLEFGAVVIALFAIGIMTLARLLVSRIRRVAAAASTQHADSIAEGNGVTRRQVIERAIGVSLFGATTSTLGWGMVRGRHAFTIDEVVVRLKDWPSALEGYTIAQVSDLHVGAFVGERELEEGFELVAKIRPDLLVATGDLVDFEADAANLLARYLLRYRTRDGAFAILGNHDHYAGAAEVAGRLQASGVQLLSNRSVRLREGDGGGFALIGVDDLHGRRGGSPGFRGPDLRAATRTLPPQLPRILLAHQPSYFDESAGRIALQLSGHTHGGQINPGFRPVSALMKYVAGRYDLGSSTLYVNRGFGVTGPPARIGAPPEVTKIVLVRS